MKKVKYVGLDVHKNAIAIAIADEGRDGEVRSYGTIANTAASIDKFLRKIVSDGSEPDFVYEAGPCGYTLFRQTDTFFINLAYQFDSFRNNASISHGSG